MEENKRTKRNKKNRKKVLLLFAIVIIILSIIFIPRIFNKNNNSNKIDKSLLGLWTIDGYTDYEFSENGKGKLIVPSKDYPFTYKIEEKKLYIDFENETSIDSSYEYSFEDEKMIWKGIEGTTGEFTFTRK